MKRPTGKMKLVVLLVPIFLLSGGMLLRKYHKVFDSFNNPSTTTEALKHSDSPMVQDKKTEAPSSVVPAEARAPGRSINSSLASSQFSNPAKPKDLSRKDIPLTPDRRGFRDSVEQAIDRVWAAPNSEAQAEAIYELANFEGPQVMEVLGAALRSGVPEVRKAALEVMREVTVHDPTMLAEVRNAVTNDSDIEVQNAALEVLVRYDDQNPETRRLLEDLIADPRGVHRDLALSELERMDLEADERSRPDTQLMQAMSPK